MEKDISTTPSASSQVSGTASRLRGVALASILGALMLTLLLEALDQTVVAVALPRIVGSLHGFDRYSWVVTAYLLASAMMVPIVGKLSDQFGRKGFLIAGVIIFSLGSLLSGISQTMDQLIIFRALQGLGAGMGIALVFTVLGDIFPPAEQAKWQGIFAGSYAISNVIGPTIGGWLTDNGPLLGNLVTDTTRWRWIFYINLPLCVLALIALLIYMPSNLSPRSSTARGWAGVRRIDFLGVLLASAATICLLLGLTWGGNHVYSWNSVQVLSLLIAAGVLYVVWFIIERHAVEPILPPALLRNRIFTADAVLALVLGMILAPLVIYMPLYLQGALGDTPTNAGIHITPMTISIVIGSALGGFIIAGLGRYQIVCLVGSTILGIGVFLMTRMTTSINLLEISLYMAMAGVGMGVFNAVLNLVAQNVLPHTQIGAGIGVINYLRLLGYTLGLAIVGSVINATQSLTNAVQNGFMVVVIFCGILLLASCFLTDVPLAKSWNKAQTEKGYADEKHMVPDNVVKEDRV